MAEAMTYKAVVFDTHQFVKKLVAAGMPELQAEVLAEQQQELIENQLATKRDLKELEMRLSHDFKIWTGSLAVVIIGVLTAIKYFG